MIDLDQLESEVVPMDGFELKWRFTDPNYDELPDAHLKRLKPLSVKAAKELLEFIHTTGLHGDFPFKKDFFRSIDKALINENNEKEIKKWLYERGLPFDKNVILSWDANNAMVVPWKLLIKYFNIFYYGVSDDLTVFDPSLSWALLFFHEDEIYFGTNKDFVQSETFDDVDFIY